MAILVAFALQEISVFLSNSKKYHIDQYALAVFVLLFTFILTRMAVYSWQHNNDHQVALNQFIQNNTLDHEPVFAYEGIGLFRPSLYHWRTSAIKLNNYNRGIYNVWDEIEQTVPVLIISSYRIPGWLREEDKQELHKHYIFITPFILTLGFSSGESYSGELLRSGTYLLTHSDNKACHLNGVEITSDSKIWLESGAHSLSTESGRCSLSWYFPKEELARLKNSNLGHRPYLYSPNSYHFLL